MKNSWRDFPTELKYALFFFILVVILTLAGNVYISLTKDKIIREINRVPFGDISFERALYLPPAFIFIKNLALAKEVSGTRQKIVFVPDLRLTISLPHLIAHKGPLISSIYCIKPASESTVFFGFLKENFIQILDFLATLPEQDISLFVDGALLNTGKKNEAPQAKARGFWSEILSGTHIIRALKGAVLAPRTYKNQGDAEIGFALTIKNKTLSGAGFFKNPFLGETEQHTAASLPLRYRFKANRTDNCLNVESLEFMREDIYCDLSGALTKDTLQFKGLLSVNTLFDWHNCPLKEPGLSFRYLMTEESSRIANPPDSNLDIINIDSRIKFDFTKIEIEHLDFLANNNPVKLKGHIVFKPFAYDFDLWSGFRNLEGTKGGTLKNISISAGGRTEGGKINISGNVDIDFMERKKETLPLEKINIALKGLNFSFGESPVFKATLENLFFFCKTTANSYDLNLDSIDAEVYRLNDKSKMATFNSRFYGGRASGKGIIEIKQFTPVMSASINLDNVDANRLDGLLMHFSKIHGNLKSRMHFTSSPRLALKGRIDIQNGYLKDFEFFKWLADLFGLPVLRKITFDNAGSEFLADEKGAGLFNMNLDSDNVKLKGYFKLGENDLAASKISLSFRTPVLEASPKFTPLLRLLKAKMDYLDFDFQMSGNLLRMNFQWLQSDFKQRVIKALPGFIERKVERDIERAIESISKEEALPQE